jgi:hypothetical protein
VWLPLRDVMCVVGCEKGWGDCHEGMGFLSLHHLVTCSFVSSDNFFGLVLWFLFMSLAHGCGCGIGFLVC